MRPRFAVPVVLLLLAGAASAQEASLSADTRDFDVVHLSLSIEPELGGIGKPGVVRGTASIWFTPLADGFKKLRLHSRESQIHAVTDLHDRHLGFVLKDGLLTITLAEPLEKAAEGAVRIRYVAKPTRGMYFHRATDAQPGVPTSFYTQGQGTDNRHWFPCYDLPDDRFTFDLFVTVPDELQTVGNGLKAGEEYLPGPRRTDHWVMKKRLPSYLVSIAAGPYESWTEERDGVILEFNAFKGMLEEARVAFGRAGDMLAFFGDYLDEKYPYPRYAQTVVWDFLYGGMENSTATTFNMRLLHGEDVRPVFSADGIVAHELAHQWFGDWVTYRTGHHIWLNEGFATYLTDLFFEFAEGTEEFLYRRFQQTGEYLGSTPEPHRLGLEKSPRGDLPLEMYGGKQYTRGAAVLHALRWELGDEVFRESLAHYLDTHADSAVVSEDFRRAAERTAGRDLGWFFDQWVYGAGYPVTEVSYRYDAARRDVVLKVRQTQPGSGGQGVFRLTLPVRIETATHSLPVRLPVHLREHEFRVACPEAPAWVRVNDAGWLPGRFATEQDFDAWENQANLDPEVTARIEAIGALSAHGEDGAHAIARSLQDLFWGVRAEAAKRLGEMPESRAALLALLGALEDEDARICEEVCRALGGRTREEAGEAVVRALTRDSHPYVRAAAAHAAGRLHVDGAFERLARLLDVESHREIVRQGALLGFTALGDERAVDLAIPLLDYRFGRGAMSTMRKTAMDLLLKLAPESRQTREAVFKLLSDPYFRMRGWAAEACGTYRFPGSAERLRKLRDHDRDAGVRWKAKSVLEKLGKEKR